MEKGGGSRGGSAFIRTDKQAKKLVDFPQGCPWDKEDHSLISPRRRRRNWNWQEGEKEDVFRLGLVKLRGKGVRENRLEVSPRTGGFFLTYSSR